MKRVGPRRPWHQVPELVSRCFRIYSMYIRDHMTYAEIAEQEQIDPASVYRYIKRAQGVLATMTVNGLDDLRMEAVFKRQAMQGVAMRDHALADDNDASGRSQLIRVVGEQQTAVEELQSVRPFKGGETSPMPNIVFSLNGALHNVDELDDAELAKLERRLAVIAERTVDGEATVSDDA